MADTRTETGQLWPIGSAGPINIGAPQTQRSINQLPYRVGKTARWPIIRALGVVKKACAMENLNQGNLDQKRADAITGRRDRSDRG